MSAEPRIEKFKRLLNRHLAENRIRESLYDTLVFSGAPVSERKKLHATIIGVTYTIINLRMKLGVDRLPENGV